MKSTRSFKAYCNRNLQFPFSVVAQELLHLILHIDNFRFLPLFCTGRRGQKTVSLNFFGICTLDTACSSCTNAICQTRFPEHTLPFISLKVFSAEDSFSFFPLKFNPPPNQRNGDGRKQEKQVLKAVYRIQNTYMIFHNQVRRRVGTRYQTQYR